MAFRFEQIAQPAFFRLCQTNGDHAWALLPVFADQTHAVALDLEKNTLFCSCPVYPKPCLHARAFERLFAQAGDTAFEHVNDLPEWAAALINGLPAPMPAERAGASAEQRNLAAQNRRLERLERAANGFEDLELWLLDTIRRGLATSLSEDPSFFQGIAARLADASMRSLSRRVRLLESASASDPDAWANQALATLADAALALQAFRNRAKLPEPLLHDLEAFIGIALKKEQVLADGEPVHDIWAVTGQVEEPVEGALLQRRTWLYGAKSRRFALLTDYAHGDAGFPPGLLPGAIVEGRLVFYPSAWPQRALASSDLNATPKTIEKLPGYPNIRTMAIDYATALGAQPWLTHFPVVLQNVTPVREKGQFGLADEAGKYLSLEPSSAWAAFALGGGQPLAVFGEWNGTSLFALSAVAGKRFATLNTQQ